MSWSKSFSGSISKVRNQVAAEKDPSAEYYGDTEEGKKQKEAHGILFDSAKASLQELISTEESSEDVTGFISATFSGHGSPGNSQYSVAVSRNLPPENSEVDPTLT